MFILLLFLLIINCGEISIPKDLQHLNLVIYVNMIRIVTLRT